MLAVLVIVVVLAIVLVLGFFVANRSRGAAGRSSPAAGANGARARSQPDPARSVDGLDNESAARRLVQNISRYPTHVIDLGGRKDPLWDKAYIDGHPNEPRIRDRCEVREIGRALNARGGPQLMRRVARRASEVSVEGHSVPWVMNHLESLWSDIADWTPGAAPDEDSGSLVELRIGPSAGQPGAAADKNFWITLKSPTYRARVPQEYAQTLSAKTKQVALGALASRYGEAWCREVEGYISLEGPEITYTFNGVRVEQAEVAAMYDVIRAELEQGWICALESTPLPE